ncbi:MAG: DEAD/DEAH box helicase [Patescibacteria group bacterium]
MPEHAFSEFGLDKRLLQKVVEHGYVEPTPIQDEVIPQVLRGKDVVGLANTGTGKTAAFLLPLLHNLLTGRRGQILILTPTRELALQIDQELKLFTRHLPVSSVVCIGGTGIIPQIRRLRSRNDFIIGTPGRIMDLMERGVLRFTNVHVVVLDEADRMLDMGFIDAIRKIMAQVPSQRQSLLFAATMPLNIERLVKDFLRDPVTVSVKMTDMPDTIEQNVVRVGNLEKTDKLCTLLKDGEFKKVLVFGQTKHGVEKLCKNLVHRGVQADSIHGNKTQGQRQRALQRFKEGRIQALIATDVAARGLDIQGVTHVVNYELPNTYDDYIHRIGRTGRGTNKGKALSFIS